MTGLIFIVLILLVLISSLNKEKSIKNVQSPNSRSKVAQKISPTVKSGPKLKIVNQQPPYISVQNKNIQTVSVVSQNNLSSNKNISNNLKLNSEDPNNFEASNTDTSIIDVSNEVYKISPDLLPMELKIKAVPWLHRYIYNYYDLESATYDQRKYYEIFRQNFLKGRCLDLEGNDNYAFILLFHLFKDYDQHGSIDKLKDDLNVLGGNYPKTMPYCNSFLAKKFEPKIETTRTSSYANYDYVNNWYLGEKYKKQLGLDSESTELLNRIYIPQNNFCEIEFCLIEVMKLFLNVISELKKRYVTSGTNMDEEFKLIGDVVAKKQHKYKEGSTNFRYCVQSTSKEMYPLIFKYVENAVREFYGHKRKINVDLYTSEEVVSALNSRVIFYVNSILTSLIEKIERIDEATDIELYSQNTSRWKYKFEILTNEFVGDVEKFTQEIYALAKLNARNPSIENIYFEASKFISKNDDKSALVFYVHYLFHDLKSDKFDNKQLTKTIQKSLFKNSEQLHDFQIVVSELIKDKNLENAVQAVSKIYEVKRKKIKLDSMSIVEVQEQHSETVELLNTYLQDEFEDEENSIKSTEVGNNEIQIEIISKIPNINTSVYLDTLMFEDIHLSTLDIFVKSNFTVPVNEFSAFSKSKGVLKNQVIDSLNEKCFDCLDDVLIEEEQEYYTIEPNYYKKLLRP